MPYTIHSEPQSFNNISQGSCFEISMTGVDTDTEKRSLRYQVCDILGNPITPLESIHPKEGEIFPLDFRDDVKKKLSTAPPRLCEFGIEIFPEFDMTFTYIVKFHEYVFDKRQCKGTIEQEYETQELTIINSVNQFYGYNSTINDGFFLLGFFAEYTYICKGCCDFLYIHADPIAIVQLNVYRKFGNTGGLGSPYYSDTVVLAGTQSLQIDPVALGTAAFNQPILQPPTLQEALDSIHAVEVVVNGRLVTTIIYTCCCCDTKLLYKSFLGGYRYMQDMCIEAINRSTNYAEVCVAQGKTDPYDDETRTIGGVQIRNKKSFRNITLSKVLTRDEVRDLRLYEDFLNSESYYLEFEELAGFTGLATTKRVTFIPTSGAVRYYTKETEHVLVITGKINAEYNLPQ